MALRRRLSSRSNSSDPVDCGTRIVRDIAPRETKNDPSMGGGFGVATPIFGHVLGPRVPASSIDLDDNAQVGVGEVDNAANAVEPGRSILHLESFDPILDQQIMEHLLET